MSTGQIALFSGSSWYLTFQRRTPNLAILCHNFYDADCL